MGLEAGETALYLSGIKIDLAELDIFSLLETLKSETTVLEGVHAFGFRGADVGKLAALELKSGQEKYALDIRDGAVVFLNDLEKDDRYRGWPGSVQVCVAILFSTKNKDILGRGRNVKKVLTSFNRF